MWCTKCSHELMDCTCRDIEERLAKVRDSPHVALRWCVVCNRHQDRCVCMKPEAN